MAVNHAGFCTWLRYSHKFHTAPILKYNVQKAPNAELYGNKKGHFLNKVQVVCGPNLEI